MVTPIIAESPGSQQQDSGRLYSRTDMEKTDKIILHGVLRKKMTVGYRSPYFLTTADGKEFEIHGSDIVDWHEFDKFIGKQVEITGEHVLLPAEKATPGSEAESRFVGGIIPGSEYIEAQSIRSLQAHEMNAE
jgi:hypothetical protein